MGHAITQTILTVIQTEVKADARASMLDPPDLQDYLEIRLSTGSGKSERAWGRNAESQKEADRLALLVAEVPLDDPAWVPAQYYPETKLQRSMR